MKSIAQIRSFRRLWIARCGNGRLAAVSGCASGSTDPLRNIADAAVYGSRAILQAATGYAIGGTRTELDFRPTPSSACAVPPLDRAWIRIYGKPIRSP